MITNAEEAAQAFIDGREDECQEWCKGGYGTYSETTAGGARRTAAVALELRVLTVNGAPGMPTIAFLRMLAGTP